MPAPATHDFVHLEISSASVLNSGVNGPINYLIGRQLGSDDAIELEDSLEIQSGGGGHYLRLPQGTKGQRPTGKAGMLRLNTTDAAVDFHDGVDWDRMLRASLVNFETLDAAGDVGNGPAQLPRGTHRHELGAFTRVVFQQTIAVADITASNTWQIFKTQAVAQGNNLVLAGHLRISDTGHDLSCRVRVAGATVAASAINRGSFPSGLSGIPRAMAPFGGVLCIADDANNELWTLDDITDPASAINRGGFPSVLTAPRAMAPFANLLCIVDESGDELWTLDDITDPGQRHQPGRVPVRPCHS